MVFNADLKQAKAAQNATFKHLTFDRTESIDDNSRAFKDCELQISISEDIVLGRLTTHVLDTAAGRPAKNMSIALYSLQGDQRRLLKETITNDDGRCSTPLLEGDAFKAGTYELVFDVGRYFSNSPQIATPPFLGEVPIRFSVGDEAGHYHVPLLVSPWSYSTYRGS